MKRSNQLVGAEGERRAAAFLLAKGYKIIDKNVRFGRLGEIDLLMKDADGTLVIVEVKTRHDSQLAEPQDAVDYKKQQTLTKLAQLISDRNPEVNVRVDVIEIDQSLNRINHLENITQ